MKYVFITVVDAGDQIFDEEELSDMIDDVEKVLDRGGYRIFTIYSDATDMVEEVVRNTVEDVDI